jgi:tripartite-type tricarboxylate transporter receptor subunit TctC
MNALVGGQVDMMCDQTTNTTGPESPTGRVKAYAVTTSQPLKNNKILKDLPTLKEMGLRHAWTIWHGL